MQDPLSTFAYDHEHLTKMVDDIRELVQACLRDEVSLGEFSDDIRDLFAPLADEVFHHFDREEQTLFPFIVEHVPEFASRVEALVVSHDRISGAMSRTGRLLRTGLGSEDGLDKFIAVFARFDAAFVKHADQEAALLEALTGRLAPQDQAQLEALLADF